MWDDKQSIQFVWPFIEEIPDISDLKSLSYIYSCNIEIHTGIFSIKTVSLIFWFTFTLFQISVFELLPLPFCCLQMLICSLILPVTDYCFTLLIRS